MVEANPAGDGVARPVQYASFRKDKAPSPGYSAELISNRVDRAFYDNLGAQPHPDGDLDTTLKLFKRNVREHGQMQFLGTREQLESGPDGKPRFGAYQWKSYQEVDGICTAFAKGLMKLELCPEIEGEDRMWRFCGIWSKNRWEWSTTLLANMHQRITTVGFYDAMSEAQVDFILKQTKMETLVCTRDYAQKVVLMRKHNLAGFLKTLIVMDDISAELESSAKEVGLKLRAYSYVITQGDTVSKNEFPESHPDDVYILSYTSGTTGDSKGAKLNYRNIISNARCSDIRIVMQPGETMVSYLPYTHVFEQMLFTFAVQRCLRIGFFSGDALRLVEDCQVLRPNVFPSVPRLYNRIYSKLQALFAEATGCKKWLVDRAVAAKQGAYNDNGRITHGCWDAIVFKKARQYLGGNVRLMVTGSAPIDKTVIDFLKITFSCPILEGYGLTESAAASSIVSAEDINTGHVGGPVESVKFRLKDLPEMGYTSSDKPYPRGEVCMYGPSIFSGYYLRPDKTGEAFDEEGWFLTGDVVQVYPNGSLKIIDRSKNLFKLAQGEYIAPEKIEGVLGLAPSVAQAFLYGDSFKGACVCVIVPEESWMKTWARDNEVAYNFAEMCKNSEVKKAIGKQMMEMAVAKKLNSLEKPKEFILWPEQFTIENNLITSTFKLKRNVAAKFFKPQIDEMYAALDKAEAARR